MCGGSALSGPFLRRTFAGCPLLPRRLIVAPEAQTGMVSTVVCTQKGANVSSGMSAKAEVFTSMSALTPESGHSAGPKADIDGILDWPHSLLSDDTKRRRPFQEFKQIRCSIMGFRGRADRATEHCLKLDLGRQRSGKLDTRSGERWRQWPTSQSNPGHVALVLESGHSTSIERVQWQPQGAVNRLRTPCGQTIFDMRYNSRATS
jgi:hypothetical protein